MRFTSFFPCSADIGFLPIMIEYKKGNKHEKDRIVLVNGHQITYKELAEICITFYKNENNIYPPPRFLGGEYFANFIRECLDKKAVTKEILKRYKLDDRDRNKE